MPKPPKFNYDQDFRAIDFRAEPELYQVGIGEQGVLMIEPYKSEILPHWRFKTPEDAEESSCAIFKLFEDYKSAGDFAGMDMARKYLQMGFTRARRYANHRGGRKYDPLTHDELPRLDTPDPEKAKSALIFKQRWDAAEADQEYARCKREHKARYG